MIRLPQAAWTWNASDALWRTADNETTIGGALHHEGTPDRHSAAAFPTTQPPNRSVAALSALLAALAVLRLVALSLAVLVGIRDLAAPLLGVDVIHVTWVAEQCVA